MHTRPAHHTDLPAIIHLLRLSLGETSTPKSTAYWNWKHEDNPFGLSPVLLAEADGQLVGVRAFMRWQWVRGARTYSALRAVDTATHPGFQGRGIFKKLTLQLLDDCKRAGDDFIFNTPNEQSRPGYLKMGWEALGRVPVRLRVHRPVRVLWNKVGGRGAAASPAVLPEYSIGPALAQSGIGALVEEHQQTLNGSLTTARSLQYLQWRYAHCPILDYYALADPEGEQFLLVFYPKAGPLGTELRFVEWIARPGAGKAVQKVLRQLFRALEADYSSVAPGGHHPGFFPPYPLGPTLTFRELNTGSAEVKGLNNWAYSLGDLELF